MLFPFSPDLASQLLTGPKTMHLRSEPSEQNALTPLTSLFR